MTLRMLFALLLALSVSAEAQDGPTQRTFTLRVSVDTQGQVTAVEPQEEIQPLLLATVTAAAKAASFEPATVNGVAKPSRTSMNVIISMTPQGPNLEVKVIEVTAGGGTIHSVPPRFPPGAHRDGYSAYVWSRISYDRQGRVDTAESGVASVQFTRGPGRRVDPRRAAELDRIFRGQVDETAAKWTFTPDEVDGQPIPATVFVPTTFCVVKRGNSCNDLWTDAMRMPPATPLALDATVRLAMLRPQALSANDG